VTLPPYQAVTHQRISHLRVVAHPEWTDGKEVVTVDEKEHSRPRVTIVFEWRLIVAIVLLVLALLKR